MISLCLSEWLKWLTGWLSDWLTVYLNDGLNDWLTVWLTVWMFVCLFVWLTVWMNFCLSDCLSDCLSVCLTDWKTDGQTDRQTDRWTEWLSEWSAESEWVREVIWQHFNPNFYLSLRVVRSNLDCSLSQFLLMTNGTPYPPFPPFGQIFFRLQWCLSTPSGDKMNLVDAPWHCPCFL